MGVEARSQPDAGWLAATVLLFYSIILFFACVCRVVSNLNNLQFLIVKICRHEAEEEEVPG